MTYTMRAARVAAAEIARANDGKAYIYRLLGGFWATETRPDDCALELIVGWHHG